MAQKYALGRCSERPFLKKSSHHYDFEKCRANPQLIDIKPTRIFSVFITIVIYTHIYLKYIPYYYQEIWRTKKCHLIHRRPPTTHHQNKKKVSAIKSEILIKYKRIKWTHSCKASLLLPGGKSLHTQEWDPNKR